MPGICDPGLASNEDGFKVFLPDMEFEAQCPYIGNHKHEPEDSDAIRTFTDDPDDARRVSTEHRAACKPPLALFSDSCFETLATFKREPDEDDSSAFPPDVEMKPEPCDIVRPYRCTVGLCRLRFSTETLLDRHVKTHNVVYRCDKCRRTFVNNICLKKHRGTDCMNSCHPCVECDVTFTTLANLRRHVRMKHVAKKLKPFACPDCSCRYSRGDHLKAHSRIHQRSYKAPSYECSVCGLSFSRLSNLKVHRLTHGKVKQYVCRICDKGYSSAYNLNVHARSH